MNLKFWEKKKSRSEQEGRFDFYSIGDVSEAVVSAYFSATNEETRRLPLLVAAHIQAKIEEKLVSGESLHAEELSEARGGLRALHLFARLLTSGVKEWQSRNEKRRINFMEDGE